MHLFHKKTAVLVPPAGCTAADIAVESSICTGETVVGFRCRGSDALLQAALVRTSADLAAYYARYGFAPPASLPPLPKKG